MGRETGTAVDALIEALAEAVAERLPQQPASAPVEYVDRAGAAKLAGIGSELWRRITRELPAYRLGNRVVVRHVDLVEWIEQHRVQRESDDEQAPTRVGVTSDEPDPFQRLIERGRLRRVK